jgi:predicted metal-dependent phosphotriesterase family hydrolase
VKAECGHGIIGEMGGSFPLHDSERKVLLCYSVGQQITGVRLYVHPDPHDDILMEIRKLPVETCADLSRVVIGSVDISRFVEDTRRSLLDMGCIIAFYTF